MSLLRRKKTDRKEDRKADQLAEYVEAKQHEIDKRITNMERLLEIERHRRGG